jgi:hypothetical protein
MIKAYPQALLEKIASKGHELFSDISVAETQGMAGEFASAWNTIMMRSMESPEEWLKTITGFYQEQFNLWINMFKPPSEGVVEPVRGDRRFASPEWVESPLHNYLKNSYLLTRAAIRTLAERFRVIVFDNRGSGRTRPMDDFVYAAATPSNDTSGNDQECGSFNP